MNLKNASDRRGEGKGKSVIKCWGDEIHGFRERLDLRVPEVTVGTCRQLCQIVRSTEGAVEGSGLYPESIRQAPQLLFVFIFFLFLNFESMITHLQETWKIQSKVTYGSTTH